VTIRPKIRAVFLDVDDTLVDYQTAARAAFHATLGDDADYEQFTGLDHYEQFLSGELDFQAARDTRMADFLVASGREVDLPHAVALERQRFESLEQHYSLFGDALPCLGALRERQLAIGLITNNEPVHQRAKIAAVGLDRLVDAVAISGELGVAKPDARIFEHACAQLGVTVDEALHVGDNPYADAHGAHDAGLRAVWLDRTGIHDGTQLPFPVIGDLYGLGKLLD
jgi:putative hydrolase of the HAD superfamily